MTLGRRPRVGYFVGENGVVWRNVQISPGQRTAFEDCLGHLKKTIYFRSSAAGNLKIVLDMIGDRRYTVYDTLPVGAGEEVVVTVYPGCKAIALEFDAAATVVAAYVFE